MAILLNNAPYENDSWVHYLNEYLPDMPVFVYPDIADVSSVKYAATWDHPHGDFERYPNLRAILHLGAGMDLIDAQPTLPNVPIVRLVDPEVGLDMAQFALYWTLHFQRNFEQYRALSKDTKWVRLDYTNSTRYNVAIIGLGLIGTQIAQTIASNRFNVLGWSRHAQQLDGITTLAGSDGLKLALQRADVVISCLPLNDSTQHFFDSEKLSWLKHGANIINISRGGVFDDEALIDGLNSARIGAAALDVFAVEPLPQDHAYWRMPNVFVTPHMSGATYARSACRTLADNIERLEAGEDPFPIYIPQSHKT